MAGNAALEGHGPFSPKPRAAKAGFAGAGWNLAPQTRSGLPGPAVGAKKARHRTTEAPIPREALQLGFTLTTKQLPVPGFRCNADDGNVRISPPGR